MRNGCAHSSFPTSRRDELSGRYRDCTKGAIEDTDRRLGLPAVESETDDQSRDHEDLSGDGLRRRKQADQ
jgi:hypothetical protein